MAVQDEDLEQLRRWSLQVQAFAVAFGLHGVVGGTSGFEFTEDGFEHGSRKDEG